MAGTVGIVGAPDFSQGEGGVAGPGTGNPPVPPTGSFANSSGVYAPLNGPFLLNSADARFPDAIVFGGWLFVGSSPPSDTRYAWYNNGTSFSGVGFYGYVTGIGWQLIAQIGPQGPAGAAGAGAASLLSSNFTAGTVGATDLYANPANPASFPAGQFALMSDITLILAFYQSTAMNAVAQADPGTGPTLATGTGSGPGAGVVWIAFAWRNAVGTTLVSPAISITLTSGQYAQVTLPTPPPGYTTDVYASPSLGSMALQFYQNTSGTSLNVTALASGAAEPSTNTTQGVLLTRLDWGSGTASSSYVYSTSNGAVMMITGWGGGGAVGPAGTPRNTTISNGGSGFDAGNFSSTYNVPVDTGTGGYDLPGDWIKLWDGTASSYMTVNSTSTSSVNATRQNVPGDPAQAAPTYNFADGTQVSWIGAPGAPGTTGATGSNQSLLTADFTAGAESATGLTFTVASAAPFFNGAVGQMADDGPVSAWYQVTGISGLTITATRLPVDPPGVTVADPAYDFQVANGAVFALCGPPGIGPAGGTIVVQMDQALTGTVNGTNTVFTLPSRPVNSFAVYRDGVRCRQGTSGTLGYTYVSSTLQITFNKAPQQFATADID